MLLRLGLIMVCFVGLAGCVPQATWSSPSAPRADESAEMSSGELVVQAEASVQAQPDQLEIELGVISEAASAEAALAANNRSMNALLSALEQLGIARDDLRTGQFAIRPQWSVPPRPTPADWQRRIVAYRVDNQLQVTTERIDLTGKLISLAEQAGANQIGGMRFTLSDPVSQRQQAIRKATARARQQAQTLALAAGVKLGSLAKIELLPSGMGPRPVQLMASARSAAEAVPVATGTIEVEAGVRMVYRLYQEGTSESP